MYRRGERRESIHWRLCGRSDARTSAPSKIRVNPRLFSSGPMSPKGLARRDILACLRVREKTRGHCCRTLARKEFPKLPRNVPGFFHRPLRARLVRIHAEGAVKQRERVFSQTLTLRSYVY